MRFALCSLLLIKARRGSSNSIALGHVGMGGDEMEQLAKKLKTFFKTSKFTSSQGSTLSGNLVGCHGRNIE